MIGLLIAVLAGQMSIADAGAIGDGVKDNRNAVKIAIAAAAGGTLRVPAGTYRTTSGWIVTQPIHIECDPGAVFLLDTLPGFDTSSLLRFRPVVSKTLTFTGAVTQGQRTFTLTDATGLAAGIDVQMRLGVDPYDASQELVRLYNVVEAIDGNSVTFRLPLPEAVPDATHRIDLFSSNPQGSSVRGCGFAINSAATGGVDTTIMVTNTRNIRIEGNDFLSCRLCLNVAESENVVIRENYVRRAIRSGTAGGGISAWGNRNLQIRDLFVQDSDRQCVYLESQNRGVLIDGLYCHIGPGLGSVSVVHGIDVKGGSTGVVVRDYHFSAVSEANWKVTPLAISQDAQVRSEDVTTQNSGAAQ